MPHALSITGADLLDYVEGRLPTELRATIALRLAEDPALAPQCAELRAQLVRLSVMRSSLPVERLPPDWVDLLRQIGRRQCEKGPP